MITDLISKVVGVSLSLLDKLIPSFAIDPQALDNARSAVETLNSFLGAVNFIIPFSDILMIISIDLGIRIFKLSFFIGDKVKKTILGIIP